MTEQRARRASAPRPDAAETQRAAAGAPRVYLEQRLGEGIAFEMAGGAHHHLLHVLRMRAGGLVRVFNHLGDEFLCRVESVSRRASAIRCESQLAPSAEPSLDVRLYLALCKSDYMDSAIRKATELGVSGIQPLVTSRSAPVRGARLRHWRGIIIGACEQCGRVVLPELAEPVDLAALPRIAGDEPAFVLHPGADAIPDTPRAKPRRAHLLVGPEGSLSDDEVRRAAEVGFRPTGLGPRILRVATAVAAGVSLLQYLYGDW